MKNKLELKFSRPAEEWTSALSLGNGRLGCMVFGLPRRERIQFNEDTLWSGGPEKKEKDCFLDAVSEVRSFVNQKKYSQAQKTADEKLLGPWSSFYEPMGDLFLEFPECHERAENYLRKLDLEKAVCTVSYSIPSEDKKNKSAVYTRTVFASHPLDAIVMKIECSEKDSVSFNAEVSSLLKHEVSVREDDVKKTLVLKGKAPVSGPNVFGPDEPPVVYDEKKGMTFTSCISILPSGKNYELTCDSKKLKVKNAESVLIILTAATSFNGFLNEPGTNGKNSAVLCYSMDEKACAESYEKILRDHCLDFSNLFNRVEFYLEGTDGNLALKKLSDKSSPVFSKELAPLFFQFGRYLMISCSRKNTQPANLQGIWNQDIRPAWNCNYTTNINLEMNYWPAEICNLSECHLPLFELLKELSVTGRDVAEKRWGCRGWAANHNCDLWRKASPAGGSSEWALWPFGGAWLCTHIWEHYIHTMDKDFLVEMFPVLKGAVEFLMDFLQKESDGTLVTNPSISPENNFLDPQTKQKCCISKAGTMDMSITRELFTQFITVCEILCCDKEFALQVSEALKKLFPYKLTGDGRLREWNEDFEEAEKGHRHVSHLFGMYPGHILFENKDEEFKTAALKSLTERLSNGGGHTGWSCAWTVCLFARMKKPAEAEKYLNVLFNKLTYKNLFNVCPPYQIDGNFGGTAAVAEMLVQSGSCYDGENTYIELLPCLPESWSSGYVRGLKVRGGHSVDMEWQEGKLKKALIKTKGSGNMSIFYKNKKKICNFGEDGVILLDSFLI
ncbi:glycoside hydrolase family 95 protein [Treponema sp.]|uniref:glycoside hydrolase family 95 protein n=1 Tax=Treponema sp. TaxID=166 RepID=UPI00258115CB|nr:glycoside hydrolase family 95 protein [Treponema sp.]MBE6355269.1 glycoside hydrolase family 95 protein [Treponema sp.]